MHHKHQIQITDQHQVTLQPSIQYPEISHQQAETALFRLISGPPATIRQQAAGQSGLISCSGVCIVETLTDATQTSLNLVKPVLSVATPNA